MCGYEKFLTFSRVEVNIKMGHQCKVILSFLTSFVIVVHCQDFTTILPDAENECAENPYLDFPPDVNTQQLELLRKRDVRLGYIAAGRVYSDRIAVQISGAMTMAVNDVNSDLSALPGYNVSVYFANTTGDELDSLEKMALLWKEGVIAFFGPDITCEKEARFAAALNLPMISYACIDYRLSDKKNYPTFARTNPTDKQLVRAVVLILKHFNWSIVSIVSAKEAQRVNIVEGLRGNLSMVNISVQHEEYFDTPCFSKVFAENDPDAECKVKRIVEATYVDTRIYIFLGEIFELYAFMDAMYEKKLLHNGEYLVIYVSVSEYNGLLNDMLYGGGYSQCFQTMERIHLPERLDRGYITPSPSFISFEDPYSREPSRASASGYRAVLQIYASPVSGNAWQDFRKKQLQCLRSEPYNRDWPKEQEDSIVVPANAAYLYDAVVNVYIPALKETLKASNATLEDAIDGAKITKKILNRTYKSVAGNLGYIAENGDAFVDFVVIGARPNISNRFGYNIEELAYLRFNESTRDMSYQQLEGVDIPWISGRPLDMPKCGFYGELCPPPEEHYVIITAAIFAFLLLVVLIIVGVKYRNYKYEQDLMGLLWKIDYDELDFRMKGGSQNTLGSRVSQMTCDSKQSKDPFRGQIFTDVARYRGQCVAIKNINTRSWDLNRTKRKELKIIRELKNDNLNPFVGACVDPSRICIVSEYCRKGSLQDILENEDVKLDHLLIASIISDIVRGMIYLHTSEIFSHGGLKSSNCLIDSRWVVRISDYGLPHMRQVDENTQLQEGEYAYYRQLLWRAPELLRDPNPPLAGTQKGDVYSFAIILYEIALRDGPYGSCDLSPQEIVKRVRCPDDPSQPFRPNVMVIENCDVCVLKCMQRCWEENPEDRPDFKSIRNELKPLRRGMKSNILDNMISIMEKYANNLEDIVENRTQQLIEEKKKTDNLLHQMLPRAVANHLKRGMQVVPESFDCVTIFFSDIVGFTSLSSQSTPFQVVDLLNDLYTLFDTIISYYDVYKVETIGDAYMIVSGLPIRNGNMHAGEIASTALHLLDAVQRFRIRHKPNETLKLRIGIHSGPVVAGVVGSTMPRYCLFGDTVNTASRMESNGEALKIHVSTECQRLLVEITGYKLRERGYVTMKGKGELLTYWLEDQDPKYRRNQPLKLDSDDQLSNYEPRGSNTMVRRSKILSPTPCSVTSLGAKDSETKLSNQVLNALGLISDNSPDGRASDPDIKRHQRPHSTCMDSFSTLESIKSFGGGGNGLNKTSSIDGKLNDLRHSSPENSTTPMEDNANESTRLLADDNKKIRFSDSALGFKIPVNKVNSDKAVPNDVETAV